jgi:hypothetical protein
MLFVVADHHSLRAAQADFSATAQQAFQEAQTRYQHEPQSSPAAVDFSRACFDLAEFATNSTQRAELAEQGMAASRRALALISNSAPAHYYLGMNLGQLARTKGLGALKLVNQMEREFALARQLDEHLDYAGPDRNLGALYRDTPVIASIGSRTKARQHLERAVELAPEYPENHLNLTESYLKWGYRAEAQRQLKALEETWPPARAKLTGPRWASSWADWEPRFEKLKKKLQEPSKTLESPREKR